MAVKAFHKFVIMPAWSRGWSIATILFLFICCSFTSYFLYDTFKNNSGKIVRKLRRKLGKGVAEGNGYDLASLDPTDQLKKGYILWSPSCRIPDLDPHDMKVKDFFRHYPVLLCSTKPLLSNVVREKGGNHTLVFNNESVKYYNSNQEMFCCYSLVSGTDDADIPAVVGNETKLYSIGDCLPLHSNITFSKDEQSVFVKCIIKTDKLLLRVYKNLHTFVRKTNKTKRKIQKPPEKKKLSVLMVGIDSLSRLNFIRLMPHAHRMLLQDWIEFEAYGKVGASTLPNLLAVLTGLSVDQIPKVCGLRGPQDNCPLIWKNFADEGYVTAYGEDEPHGNSFHYNSSYFIRTYTDHYFRPYMAAADDLLTKRNFRNFTVCAGPTYLIEHTLSYSMDFLKEYENNATFSLFWFNSFSHNDISGPSMMDYKFTRYFQDLRRRGVLNSTLVIFFSDHGPRFGFYRSNYFGWLENRLPMLFLHVPDWWKRENPIAYRTLLRNRFRLASPYDLHLTLREVLGRTGECAPGCPTCSSLFQLLPHDRGCEHAGIPSYWCPCKGHKVVDFTQFPIHLRGELIVQTVNNITRGIPKEMLANGSRCAEMTLKRVMSAIQIDYELQTTKQSDEHIIMVEASPGAVLFEAAVLCNRGFTTVCSVAPPVRRVSPFENTTFCIENEEMSTYCVCVSENSS